MRITGKYSSIAGWIGRMAVCVFLASGSMIYADDANVHEILKATRSAMYEDRLVDAIAHAERAIMIDPGFAETWKLLGRAFMLVHRNHDALNALNHAWALDPDWNSDVAIWKADLLLRLDLLDDFHMYIKQMPDSGLQNRPKGMTMQWLNYLCDRSYEHAASLLASRLAQFETDEQIRRLYLTLKDDLITGGVGGFASIHDVDTDREYVAPLLGLILHQRARSLLRLDKVDEAEVLFRHALDADPSRRSARSDLGWLYRTEGRLDDAIAMWRSNEPDSITPPPGWLVWIAEAEYDAGRLDNAVQALEQALSLDPHHALAIASRHCMYLKLGRLDEIREYEQIANRDQILHDAMLRGRVRFVLASPDLWTAVEVLKKIEGKNSDALMLETYRLVGESSPGHIRSALLEAAIQEAPDAFDVLREMASVKWSLGQDNEAITLWKKATQAASKESDELLVDVVEELIANDMASIAEDIAAKSRNVSEWSDLARIALQRTRRQAAKLFLGGSYAYDQSNRKDALYLAWLNAAEGRDDGWRAYAATIRTGDLPSYDYIEIDLLNEITLLREDVPELRLVMENYIRDEPYYDAELTELMVRVASQLESDGNHVDAYRVYQRIVKRDPGNTAWLDVIRLGPAYESAPDMDAIVEAALKAPVHPAIHYRIQSIQSRRQGRIPAAIMHAWESLDRNASQVEARAELFDLLMAEQRYPEAITVVNWFGNRLYESGSKLLAPFARMMLVLTEHPEVYIQWAQSIHDHRDAIRFVSIVAEYYIQSCDFDHAWRILDQGLRHYPEARLFTMISELELSRGLLYDEAIDWAEKGLQSTPSPGLYRLRAELAEITYDWPTAYTNATIYLSYDPGYAPMHRLTARALEVMQEYETAIEYNRELISRNEIYLPAVVGARDASTRLGAFDQALAYAELHHAQRPGEPEAIRRLAVSLAESGRFVPAIRLIKPLSTNRLEQAIPVLIYRGVSSCNLDGRNNTGQVKLHMEQLKSAGYRLINPADLLESDDAVGLMAMIVLVDPDPRVVVELDAFMHQNDMKVVLAVDVPVFQHAVPGVSSRTMYAGLVKSGRWFVASSGPGHMQRTIVQDRDVKGNPYTHRITKADGTKESLNEMELRLDRVLGDAARSLPAGIPPVFVYAQGDYGQLSLDCSIDEIDTLKKVVDRHFTLAIAQDESGYVTPGFDPLRLAGRVVPPSQTIEFTSIADSSDIVEYLKPRNPILRSKLDMARILYWHRQYTRANKLFEEVHEAGADPSTMMYHWGANAFKQGDLPRALDKLRLASQSGSLDQDRIFELLDTAERQKRPDLEAWYEDWQDSDDREYEQFALRGSAHVRDDIKLGIQLDSLEYRRRSAGSEDAIRTGLGALWYFMPERWLTGEIQWLHWSNDDLDDQINGSIQLHSKSRWLNGHWDLRYQRDQVPTVEAVRKEVQSDTVSLMTYSFLFDQFDAYADGHYMLRTDDNDSWTFNGRILYRVMEWPYLGAGYRVRLADSDEKVPEYYSPLDLERHTAFVSLRGIHGMIHYSLSGEWGYAREQERDWVDVWSINAQGEWRLHRDVRAVGGYTRLETPSYELDSWKIGLNVRF